MKEKLAKIISITTIPILLALGTTGVYLYAKGYRIDIPNGSFEQTGVLSVNSVPKRASITFDGVEKGRTPKTISGITPGMHTVTLTKDGYFDWTMEVQVDAETLVPIETVLFLKKPVISTIFPSETDVDPEADTRKISSFHTDARNSLIVFSAILTRQEEKVLELWTYPVQKRFWEINVAPTKIAEFPSGILPDDFEVLDPVESVEISPNGQKVLLHIKEATTTQYYVLESGSLNEDPKPLPELLDHSHVNPEWSGNSIHIVYSKNNELRSINTETGTNTVITENPDNTVFVWTSSKTGQLFFLSDQSEGIVEVTRTEANGSNKTTILTLPDEEQSKSIQYIDPSLQDISNSQPAEEPQNMNGNRTGGLSFDGIYDIRLTPNEESIIFFNDTAIIAYTMKDDSFQAYTAKSPEFISFSPDEEKFIYFDSGTVLKKFRFIIEDGDPIHILGPKTLIDTNTEIYPFGISDITWHPESANIFFSTASAKSETEAFEPDTKEYSISILNTQNLQVVSLEATLQDPALSIDNTGNYLLGRCTDNTFCSMTIIE